MKVWHIILLPFFSATLIQAQNLVPNPGFETTDEIVLKRSQNTKLAFNATKWFSANKGTPDLVEDETHPRNGKACAGIINWSRRDHREYLQTQLTDTLQKDQLYRVQFFAQSGKLSSRQPYAMNHVGALLSTNRIAPNTWGPIIQKAAVEISSTQFLQPDDGWVQVSGVYRALGGEQYLTIGNFYPAENISKKLIYREKPDSEWQVYYFIDDVSVIKVSEPETVVIYFDTDKDEPTKASLNEFRAKLVEFSLNGHCIVELKGHTDDTQPASRNEELSQRRATFMKDWLLQHYPLPEENIAATWFGETAPATKNTTAHGKAQNRRVEVLIYCTQP